MSMIPEWKGRILIPALPERRFKVGQNTVVQKPFLATRQSVKIFSSQHEGHFLVRTEMAEPFSEFLIRKNRAKKIESPSAVLYASAVNGIENISEETVFSWESYGQLENHALSPESVLESWQNKFFFKLENDERNLPGLRPPQIGALHAISAHFAIGDIFDPATIVLPTGTGKTETMLAMQVYSRYPKPLFSYLRMLYALKFLTNSYLWAFYQMRKLYRMKSQDLSLQSFPRA